MSISTEKVTFGDKLKQLRIEHGVTQKQIAEYLGIAPNSLQSLEYGKTRPTYENLVKLCNYFQVSADYLLGLSDTKERQP